MEAKKGIQIKARSEGIQFLVGLGHAAQAQTNLEQVMGEEVYDCMSLLGMTEAAKTVRTDRLSD